MFYTDDNVQPWGSLDIPLLYDSRHTFGVAQEANPIGPNTTLSVCDQMRLGLPLMILVSDEYERRDATT